MSATDTRAVMLMDIPLIKRLCESGTTLHNELGFTRGVCDSSSLLISNIVFPRELYQFVTRTDDQSVVGQVRHVENDVSAHIVYILPDLAESVDTTAWLHNLDTLAREAGKLGAHHLLAEVEPDTPLFELMRSSGFAVYARQSIWRHESVHIEPDQCSVQLHEAMAEDEIGILALFTNTIPTMLQQVLMPGSEHGFVYRRGDRTEAYIAVAEGKLGVYLTPYMHPDIMSDVASILEATIARVERSRKAPIFVCIRGFQSWIENGVRDLQFRRVFEQAIMVRHIAAGVRQTHFSPVRLSQTAQKNVVPPTNSIVVDKETIR